MLRTMLIALDGSPFCQVAVELGIAWARRFEVTLAALGIVDEEGIRGPEATPLGGAPFKSARDHVRLVAARQRVDAFVQQFSHTCATAGVKYHCLESVGAPHEQIVLHSQRYDTILLGLKTFFRAESEETGDDTLEKVLKQSPRPLVTVPQTPRNGTSVVVAYDGSLQAARTLQAFQEKGLDGAQEVHVVTVAADRNVAQECAARAADFLRYHDINVLAHPIASTASPATVLLEQANYRDARLLVMGAYGQPVMREFFFGSVTRTVLQESQVPVFLYH